MSGTRAGDVPALLDVEVAGVTALRFTDGSPVRAASAIAPFADGWLIVQDDTTDAAWWRADGHIEAVRLFPPVEGRDRFSEADGTKHLKPDLEGACPVDLDGASGVLLLGSGSLPNRARAALVTATDAGGTEVVAADLGDLYARVGDALGVSSDRRNLEGACVVDDRLRWFQRGDVRCGVEDASIDVDLAGLLAALVGDLDPGRVELGEVRRYDLSRLAAPDGEVPLAITDAVTLPGDRVLIAAAAEDTDDPVADGPVSASALAVVDGADVLAAGRLPSGPAGAWKVEGLSVVASHADAIDVLAVVDGDDPDAASPALRLTVTGTW